MTIARALTAALLAVTAARALAACADGGSPAGNLAVPDGGPTASPCGVTSNCANHNEFCVRGPSANEGACIAPMNGGLCAPTASPLAEVPGCYPGARCQPVPTTQSPLGGMCSFGEAPGAVFQVAGGEKIALQEPSPFNTYTAEQAITFRWTPPAGQTADTTAVTVLTRRPPLREPQHNRLRNPQDIVWIWASTDPGGAAPGAVSLRAGRRGLRADGSLGEGFSADTLPAGRYWWLTYTLRDGAVRAASDVFTFRVGPDVAEEPCANVSQCIERIPGEPADLIACVYGRCRRRCASDVDCPGARRRCAVSQTLSPPDGGAPEELPRGAFCATR